MKDNFKYICWLIITFIASVLAIPCMIIGSITNYFAKQMFNLIESTRAYFKLKEFKFKFDEYHDNEEYF